eukprot:1378604-Pleurochrysis_carterae.AAC.1
MRVARPAWPDLGCAMMRLPEAPVPGDYPLHQTPVHPRSSSSSHHLHHFRACPALSPGDHGCDCPHVLLQSTAEGEPSRIVATSDRQLYFPVGTRPGNKQPSRLQPRRRALPTPAHRPGEGH